MKGDDNIELYDYQSELITELRTSWRAGFRRPCLVLPCGGGKSVIASEIAKRTTYNKNEVMYLVHRQELCQQITDTFTAYGVDMDLCSVNMVQTATRHLDKYNPALIITDENHHCLATTYRRIYEAYSNAYCVGLTATPVRLGGGGLGDVNDKLIIGPSVKWLIENKRLAPYSYYAPSLADVSVLKTRAGDYSADEAEILLDKPKIYGDVIRYYRLLADDQKAVCYCSTRKHSKTMAQQFVKAGITAEHIDGETPENKRAEIIKAFRRGDIKILCNVDLISEGFDVPDCTVSILLRPTKSLTLFVQQSMRCMRYQPGKKAIIIDHVGNVHRHGLPDADREWSLNPKKPTKKQTEAKVKIKQCPDCFYTHEPDRYCPNCGHVYELTREELKEQQEARLMQITSAYKSPDQCRNVQELHAFVKNKGYKSGYAYILAKQRGWLR